MIDPHLSQSQSDITADILGLCDVHRWVVIKTLRAQSVAEHSFAVAAIALELAERLFITDPESISAMLKWALVHDVPETLTGDIDGKFKRDYPSMRRGLALAEQDAFPWWRRVHDRTPDHIYWIIKTADYIEALAFIRMWGIGPRADDIYRELQAILDRDTIPSLRDSLRAVAAYTGDLDGVRALVTTIMNHSVGESNCIQLRRHRGLTK